MKNMLPLLEKDMFTLDFGKLNIRFMKRDAYLWRTLNNWVRTYTSYGIGIIYCVVAAYTILNKALAME